METHCVKCRKNTKNLNLKIFKTKNGTLIMQSKYAECGIKKRKKQRIEKFMQSGNTNFIYRNELDKACSQHDMAYGKSKDLAKRTQSDEVSRDKAFKIPSDPKYDGYQRRLASMVCKFFDKKSSGSGVDTEPNYQLTNELHKQIIRKFKRRKVFHRLETIFGVLI